MYSEASYFNIIFEKEPHSPWQFIQDCRGEFFFLSDVIAIIMPPLYGQTGLPGRILLCVERNEPGGGDEKRMDTLPFVRYNKIWLARPAA